MVAFAESYFLLPSLSIVLAQQRSLLTVISHYIYFVPSSVPKGYRGPVFLEELEALLTAEGTVSLECKVVGVPTPVLKWYKDGVEIKAGKPYSASLQILKKTSSEGMQPRRSRRLTLYCIRHMGGSLPEARFAPNLNHTEPVVCPISPAKSRNDIANNVRVMLVNSQTETHRRMKTLTLPHSRKH